MDLAVAMKVIEKLSEFISREAATRTGVVEVVGVAWIFGNKRENFLAKGGVIFFCCYFFSNIV